MSKAVLVTGGSGQVGRSLARLAPAGFELVMPTRAELDLSDPVALDAMVSSRAWAAVVSCGAYTAVDKAESDVVAAWQVNALAPAALAAATAKVGIPIVHLSTDYVFDGTSAQPYRPGDPVTPLGVYGASKEGGEQAVRTANPRHVILRTAWVVSPFGNNFVKTMLRLGRERPALRVVADQHGNPTSALDIAKAIVAVLDTAEPAYGTHHFVNAGDASWHALAAQVLARAGIDIPVEPIGTAEYPTPAKRPAFSRLDTSSFTAAFGYAPRSWEEAIDEVVDLLTKEST